jgi:two-component system, OmpR family, response regulator ResD
VLVAEDDPSVRMTLEFVLVDEGFDVLFAENGRQALDLALSEDLDCILLDQLMPIMDGTEVLAKLRQNERTKGLPVFVLSGMARKGPEDWGDAFFVGKPFSPEDLVSRIKNVLTRT